MSLPWVKWHHSLVRILEYSLLYLWLSSSKSWWSLILFLHFITNLFPILFFTLIYPFKLDLPHSFSLLLLGGCDFTLTQTYLSPEGGSPRESGGTEATIGVSLWP
jgi:hypothetical protein